MPERGLLPRQSRAIVRTATDKASPEIRDARRARAVVSTARIMEKSISEAEALTVLHALDGLGQEVVQAGTWDMVEALTAPCPDCFGSGEGGDSDFGPAPRCEPCRGWGRVPRDEVGHE